ncbi:hypothetical protein SAMN05216304_104256 [Bosea sp. OK403]|nr:hypothetical protein SAMN05216304_104256 [Bosea sp. OK403]
MNWGRSRAQARQLAVPRAVDMPQAECPDLHAALALRSEAAPVRKPHPLLREAGLSPLPAGRTRSAGRVRQKIRGAKIHGEGAKKTCSRGPQSVYRVHPIRTCLWPRVSRWASGQEAGQPPGVGDGWRGMDIPSNHAPGSSQGNCHRTATGSRRRNRRTPNLHGGRSLKQRRNGLFLVSLVLQRPAPKRLVLHCRACGVSPSDGYQSPNLVVRLFLASPSRLESPTA